MFAASLATPPPGRLPRPQPPPGRVPPHALALVLVLFLMGLASPAATAREAAEEPSAWVQLVEGGVAEVRMSGAFKACPEVLADGRPVAMTQRAAPSEGFPDRVCQGDLPKGTRRAETLGRPLPVPRARFDRIVVMGDTGCRVSREQVQDCNDPNAWPFALVSRLAAAEHPDLVIHVGDYYYRESACPPGRAACSGSPHGDVWPTWRAEFFTPARPLLEAAPWVFTRGNHETCARGGPGWFRLLDAAREPGVCPGDAAPFAVPIGGVTLHVLDSADAPDRSAPPDRAAAFASALATVKAEPHEAQWVVTHRPIWGLVPVIRLGPIGPLNLEINATEQAAARTSTLEGVALILSGHIHHFASLSFGPKRPAQLIVGTGGDVGEAADTSRMRQGETLVDGLTARTLQFDRFGYFVLERDGSDWRGVFKNLEGKVVAACTLSDRALDCAPSAPS